MGHTIEKDWTSNAGYRCVIVRCGTEYEGETRLHLRPWLCGYVGLPPGHLLHGVGYSDDCPALRDAMDRAVAGPIGKRGIIEVLCYDPDEKKATPGMVFDVHGSLTYADGNAGYPAEHDGLWWLGFDCTHADDSDNPKGMEYVEAECESLARQIAEVVNCPAAVTAESERSQ